MSRLVNAWDALMGRLPQAIVEESVVEVGTEDVTLYRISSDAYAFVLLSEDRAHLLDTYWPTCEAAFAAIDGALLLNVEQVQAVRVGRRYFLKSSEVKVSKPRKVKRP